MTTTDRGAVKAMDFLHTVISARTRPWSVVVPAALVLAAVFAFLGGVFGAEAEDRGDAIWLFVAGGCVLVTAAYPFARAWARRVDERVELDEGSRLRILLRDGLQPLERQIARMPALTPAERARRLEVVASDAVWVFQLLMPGVDGLRAVLYELNDDATEMLPIAQAGRGGRPAQPFRAGTEPGDSAIALVTEARTVLESDVARSRPPGWAGSGVEYQTFISTSVHDGENAYGMLTIDAPAPGSLVRVDQRLVEVVAGLVAIGFAIAKAARPTK